MEKIEPTVKTVEEEFAEAASGEQSERLNASVANNGNGVITRQSLKEIRRLIIVGIIPAVAVVMLLLYTLYQSATSSPPFVYDVLTLLNGPEFCPGDTLHMQVDGRIRKAPLVVMVIRNIYSPETNNNVVADTTPVWRTLWKTGEFVNLDSVYTLPETIAPGNYEYHAIAQSLQSESTTISVPFSVRDGCAQGTTYLPMRFRQ